MEPDLKKYERLLRSARAAVEERGWTQGDYVRPEDGTVCLFGAVHVATGKDYLSRAVIKSVLGAHGFQESWNDHRSRVVEEVLELLGTFKMDHPTLSKAFGPNWRGVLRVAEQAFGADSKQAVSFSEMERLNLIEWHEAFGRARGLGSLVEEIDRFSSAIEDLSPIGRNYYSRFALRSALRGSAARNAIDHRDYETLIGPWREVFGE